MNGQAKYAAIGALAGACLALVMMFGAFALGLVPQRLGAQIRSYLLAHPEILVEMQLKLEEKDATDTAREQQAALRAIDKKSFFDPRIAFVSGPANARNTFVEFYDYDCPFCRASLPAVKKFYDEHKADTRFSFIEFPLPSLHGPSATLAARASLAARRQPDKFIAFHFALMAEDSSVTEDMVFADAAKAGLDVAKLKADMADGNIDNAIDVSRKLAIRAKIDGTPAFIVNGRIVNHQVDGEDLKDLIRQKPA
jgi:protein-disulfide isomerase